MWKRRTQLGKSLDSLLTGSAWNNTLFNHFFQFISLDISVDLSLISSVCFQPIFVCVLYVYRVLYGCYFEFVFILLNQLFPLLFCCSPFISFIIRPIHNIFCVMFIRLRAHTKCYRIAYKTLHLCFVCQDFKLFCFVLFILNCQFNTVMNKFIFIDRSKTSKTLFFLSPNTAFKCCYTPIQLI